MKKFKNVRPEDIIVINDNNTFDYCVITEILKYNETENTIQFAATSLYNAKRIVTPELYMNAAHVVGDLYVIYETTNYNIHTFSFMEAIDSDTRTTDYYNNLMKYKYNTTETFVNKDIYDRDNVDARVSHVSLTDVLNNAIDKYEEQQGYYEYIQRVKPKKIETLVFHTDGCAYKII